MLLRVLFFARAADGQGDCLSRKAVKSRVGIFSRIQVHLIDGQDIIARLHIHAGLIERRTRLRIPYGRHDDALDAVEVIIQFPVDPQVAVAPGSHPLGVAAERVGMTGAEFGRQVRLDVADVPARPGVLDQRAVAGPQPLPIDMMHVGVVEEIAMPTPGVEEYLTPFFLGNEVHHQARRRDRFFDLLLRLRLDDPVATFAIDQ